MSCWTFGAACHEQPACHNPLNKCNILFCSEAHIVKLPSRSKTAEKADYNKL